MRPFLAAMAALGLLLGVAGCDARDPLAGHDWPDPSPALWEVTAPDGEKGWLFGTIHSLPEGVQWRTTTLDDALAEADLLVVEIAEMEDSSAAAEEFAEVSQTASLPPLTERVVPDRREAVAALIDRAGASEGDFADTETWAAALMLAGAVRSGDPANGADRALLQSGKPTVGLEGFERQYAIFDALSEQDQRDLLFSIAQESGNDPVRAIEAWLTGDISAIEGIGAAGLLADPELREALLDGRNRRWAAHIASLIDEGRRPFVAVGAGHMAGDTGLPALLRARGYAVRRLQ